MMNTQVPPYHPGMMANSGGHGYYTVINGTAWFYDTSVSHQDLQAQNFRLVEMLLNYQLAEQQVFYPQFTQYIEPIPPQSNPTNKQVKKKLRK